MGATYEVREDDLLRSTRVKLSIDPGLSLSLFSSPNLLEAHFLDVFVSANTFAILLCFDLGRRPAA